MRRTVAGAGSISRAWGRPAWALVFAISLTQVMTRAAPVAAVANAAAPGVRLGNEGPGQQPGDAASVDSAANGDQLPRWPDPELVELAHHDEGLRFRAAVRLIETARPDLDAALAATLDRAPWRDSPAARAAVEFVQQRRAGAALPALPQAARKPTNLLLVSIDTLRADHLGAYGYRKKTSPTIDRLAAAGAVFLDAQSTSSWTLPAHMSMFTSLYPSFHKLDRGGGIGNARLDRSEPTLTEALSEAGFITAGFVAHPFLDATWGFDRGFGLYRRELTDAAAQVRWARRWIEWRQHHAAREPSSRGFFVFLHFIDPHEPYDAPAPYQGRFVGDYAGALRSSDNLASRFAGREFDSEDDFRHVVALYDAEIRYVDANLALLLETLEGSGWLESTAVLITSDHGEEFRDHGSMGHKETLYGEQLRVPLILVHPRSIEPGQRIEGRASLVDLLPTLSDLAGVQTPAGAQGVSLLPRLERRAGGAAAEPGPRDIFAELGPLGFRWERSFYRRAVISGAYKLIYTYDDKGAVSKELYRIDTDPAERQDLHDELAGTEQVRAMSSRLESFVRRGVAYNQEFRRKNSIRLDPEQMEKLRSLGYVE